MARREISAEQAERIFVRAAELEASRGEQKIDAGSDKTRSLAIGDAGDAPGLSVAELEQIASEAGLERQHVRQAIAELDRKTIAHAPLPHAPWILGASSRVMFTAVNDRDASELDVAVIERVLQEGGSIRSSEGALRWRSYGIGSTHVAITRERIQIRGRFGHLIGGLYGGVGGGAGGGIGGPLFALVLVKTGSFMLATLAGLLTVAASIAGARAIYAAIVKRRISVLQRLLRELL